ncbi:ATP-dependent Clp protease proteolytic subunit [Spirosoma sp. KUDC1026]|uniref:ATP-dependent Clp protease proteolytic subunit n=1 Tax=Spirosoma sp. KUDC1026 TaxID=2745947 RepID=UPI00159BD0BF|nr:ATP-dependent Clp protease proteolytic subunit [Spirosoma sp. KUDC1026]QKZ15202.1 ATP-dependent Clp protease proteolytic subunit [Spirosoma sp. KUDC1026]
MPKIVKINLSGIIMPDEWVEPGDPPCISLTKLQRLVQAAGQADGYDIFLKTPGGVMEEGWAMYDYMITLPNLRTIAVGMVASMGTILLSAAKERLMTPHAQLLFHLPNYGDGLPPGNRVSYAAYLDKLAFEEQRCIELFTAVTGKSESVIAGVFADGEDHEFTAEESIAFGWATGLYMGAAVQASRSLHRPIYALLKDGKTGLSLSKNNSSNTNMAKRNTLLVAGLKGLLGLMEGKQTTSLTVNTVDGKVLDIDAAGETYVIGDALAYEDGTEVPDGEYLLSDGFTIVVAAGAISDIIDPVTDEEQPETPEPTAEAAPETITISKAEHERLLALDTTVSSLKSEHEQFKARVTSVLKGMESADPVTARVNETPIDKRVPEAPETAADRKAKRLANRK